jgi:hypothetical protein
MPQRTNTIQPCSRCGEPHEEVTEGGICSECFLHSIKREDRFGLWKPVPALKPWAFPR